MIDRIPRYPGRAEMTLEGTENLKTTEDIIRFLQSGLFATLIRADSPIAEGTLINKANLLTDATADIYTLSGTQATVNWALYVAGFAIQKMSEVVIGTYTGTAPGYTDYTWYSQTINLGFYPSALLIMPEAYVSAGTYFSAAVLNRTIPIIHPNATIYPLAEIVSNGFTVRSYTSSTVMAGFNFNNIYRYLAFKPTEF